MNELVIIGKTISTFGIKGELKVFSDFERKLEAFKVNKKIIINNIEHVITSIRYHKNLILMGIDNLDNINDVLDFVGFNIYIPRSDLELKEDEYLYTDLVGATVIDDDNTNLGIVKEVLKGIQNDFIKVSCDKEFLIPLTHNYIHKFDNSKKVVYTNKARDLRV